MADDISGPGLYNPVTMLAKTSTGLAGIAADADGRLYVVLSGPSGVSIIGPLDGDGNVKVSVQNQPDVNVVNEVLVSGLVDAKTAGDGTSTYFIRSDSAGRIEVLPCRTTSGTGAPIYMDSAGRPMVRDVSQPAFSEAIRQRLAGTVSTSGQLDIYGNTVPSGHVWMITTVGFQYTGTPPAVCLNSTHDGSYPYPLARYASPSSGSWNVWTGTVWLAPGMRVHWRFANATAGDSYVCYYIGVDYIL